MLIFPIFIPLYTLEKSLSDNKNQKYGCENRRKLERSSERRI